MHTEKLSKLADTLIGSEIVKLGNQIRARIAAGDTIYNFTVGDFDPQVFPIPVELKDEIVKAYEQHFTSYPLADGELDLRQAVSAYYTKHLGFDYTPNEIQISCGGRPLIYAIFRTIVDEGDTVIYANPSWNNNHYTHMTWAKHCMVPTTPENEFMPTAADIAPYIQNAALLCLCSPQNPTGTMLNPDELRKICAMVVAENERRGPDEKKLYVLFDQMYWTLVYGDAVFENPVSAMPAMRNYTVFVDGISKCFAATGVRVGWSFGPAFIMAKMRAILSHVGGWAPMAEQKAVAKFLGNQAAIDNYMPTFKASLLYRLEAIYKGLMALKDKGYAVDAIQPKAALYLTIQIDLVGNKKPDGQVLTKQSDVTDYLLENAGLAIVPFSAFGADAENSWYRLSVGTCKTEDIAPMLQKLETALAQLS